MNTPLPIFSVLLGGVILFFGRKVFWLCVAAFGFAAGVELAPYVLVQPTPLLQLSLALVLGFAGALLALLLQKIAVGVAGFFAGGRVAIGLAGAFLGNANLNWLTFLIGGFVGAILLISLFDWALIFLSSLLGAYLILGAITLPKTGATMVLIALTVLGVLVQMTIFRRRRAAID